MAPSRYDWKIVDWDVKPQHNQPFMGKAAILVMWPRLFEQIFIPPSHRHSIWNKTLIGPVVSEEKMFK